MGKMVMVAWCLSGGGNDNGRGMCPDGARDAGTTMARSCRQLYYRASLRVRFAK